LWNEFLVAAMFAPVLLGAIMTSITTLISAAMARMDNPRRMWASSRITLNFLDAHIRASTTKRL